MKLSPVAFRKGKSKNFLLLMPSEMFDNLGVLSKATHLKKSLLIREAINYLLTSEAETIKNYKSSHIGE